MNFKWKKREYKEDEGVSLFEVFSTKFFDATQKEFKRR